MERNYTWESQRDWVFLPECGLLLEVMVGNLPLGRKRGKSSVLQILTKL